MEDCGVVLGQELVLGLVPLRVPIQDSKPEKILKKDDTICFPS